MKHKMKFQTIAVVKFIKRRCRSLLYSIGALVVCLGMTSAADTQQCPVVPGKTGEFYAFVYHYQQSGNNDERLKIWMKSLTSERLDDVMKNRPSCARYGARLNQDDSTSIEIAGPICPDVYSILACYQKSGWPFSINPRIVQEKSSKATAAATSLGSPNRLADDPVQEARAKGYGALLDLASSRGCGDVNKPRHRDCETIAAATAKEVWEKFNCASPNLTSSICKSAILLNDAAGSKRGYLDNYLSYSKSEPVAGKASQSLLDSTRAMTELKRKDDLDTSSIDAEESRLNCSQNISLPACRNLERRRSNLMNGEPEMRGVTSTGGLAGQSSTVNSLKDSAPGKCAKEVGATANCWSEALKSQLEKGKTLDGSSIVCSNSFSYSLKANVCSNGKCSITSVRANIQQEEIGRYPGFSATVSKPFCE